MDLRKGSELKEGKRRCFRCSGRKKMYQIGKSSIWSHNNSGGVLKDCPLCLGTGQIDLPQEDIELLCEEEITPKSKSTKFRMEKEDEENSKKRRIRKNKKDASFEKEY